MRVEVGSDIAGRVSGWIRGWSWNDTSSVCINKARVALTDTIDPSRVRFGEASITESRVHCQSLATALHADDHITIVTDTRISVPDGADNRCTLVNGNRVAVSSVEESTSRAGAAHIDEEDLSSTALHANVTIPEGVLRAHALSHCGIPYPAVAARLERHTL